LSAGRGWWLFFGIADDRARPWGHEGYCVIAGKRRRWILDAVATRGSVSIAELARRIDVSVETIRRDIILLDKQSLIRRAHGGALSLDTFEPAFADRIATNIESKRAIGTLAASLVPDGATVIIDYGTTAYCVAEALTKHSNLTVFTAGIQAASCLAGRNGNEVYILGGQFQASEGATIGRDSALMLQRYFADYSFIGAGVISPHPTLMDFSREAAELRGMMLLRARVPVVLADHTKFNRMATHQVDNLEKAVYLITDKKPNAEYAKALKGLPAEILVARPDKSGARRTSRTDRVKT